MIMHTTEAVSVKLKPEKNWLAKYYSPLSSRSKTNGFGRYIFTNKVTLWAASYSAGVVYTKTIIHLSVGESSGYMPSRATTIHLHFGE